MAAFLSELPDTDRPTAERQLTDRGIEGGFLLRRNGEIASYKVSDFFFLLLPDLLLLLCLSWHFDQRSIVRWCVLDLPSICLI